MTGLPARVANLLAANGVSYRMVHHPVVYTAQELAAVTGVPGRQLAKVVMVTDGVELWMAVVSADLRIDFAKLNALVGRSLRLAAEDQFRGQFPDVAPGAVPPFGALYGVRTILDERLAGAASLSFAAGTHTDSVSLSVADYLNVAQSQVADIACAVVADTPHD